MIGAVLILVGCGEDVQGVAWRLRYAPGVEADAVFVEASILRGPCGGPVTAPLYVGRGATGTFAPMPPTRLGAGTFCFRARARDATCHWMALGESEAQLGRGAGQEVIETTMARTPSILDCSECGQGECSSVDGGTATDTGSAADADTEGDTGTEADTGTGLDAGPSCVEERAWRDVSVGWSHTCGRISSSEVYCWGNNDDGQVGSGTIETRVLRPQLVGTQYQALSAGLRHTCAIHMGGSASTIARARCWGSRVDGLLGDGELIGTMNRPSFVLTPPSRVGSIEVGELHSCSLGGGAELGELYCWGAAGPHLGLGPSSVGPVAAPRRVGTATSWRQLILGARMACALTMTDGMLYCWGDNSTGALADVPDGTDTPRRLGTEVGWTGGAIGLAHACFLRSDDSLRCFGRNTSGQLGATGVVPSDGVVVSGGHAWRSVAVARASTCAIRMDGALMCWGDNADGQLGLGSTTPSSTPTPTLVPHPTGGTFDRLSTHDGASHVCAIDDVGALYCWGSNAQGQLGLGDTVSRLSPTRVCLP